jgi:hypothetical protein
LTTRPADLASRQSLFTGHPALKTAPPSLTKPIAIQYFTPGRHEQPAKETLFTINQPMQ